ncbi:hypothetical protein ASD89_02105 [Caulobacter sp. Root656]|nr:hypothetical protein ASD89_02105 [Caulobacter sp. Root656]
MKPADRGQAHPGSLGDVSVKKTWFPQNAAHFGSPTSRCAAPSAFLTAPSPAAWAVLSSIGRTTDKVTVMTTRLARPAPGSDAYWADRKAAFGMIARLEIAIARRNQEPQHLAGVGYDWESGEGEVIENLAPWNYVGRLQDAARANPTVVEILTAQGRMDLLTT